MENIDKDINKAEEILSKELESMSNEGLRDFFKFFYKLNHEHANMITTDKFDEFLEQSRVEGEKFLDLVDVDKINGLQYLNQYRNNIMKRFLSRRGYMVQTTSKLAQQTNSEIHGSDSYALLYPLEQLRERKKMVESINSLFGTSITVRFNEILEKVYKDYMSDPEETVETKTEETEETKTEETKTEEGEDNDQSN